MSVAATPRRGRKVAPTAPKRFHERLKRYQEEGLPGLGANASVTINRNRKFVRETLNEIAEAPNGDMAVHLYALSEWIRDEAWRVRGQDNGHVE